MFRPQGRVDPTDVGRKLSDVRLNETTHVLGKKVYFQEGPNEEVEKPISGDTSVQERISSDISMGMTKEVG